MGLLLFALGLTLCLVGGPALLIFRACRRIRSPIARTRAVSATAVTAFVSVWVLSWPMLQWLVTLTVVQGDHVSASEYRALGPQLPPEAADALD
jgi:hypothetical protein